MRLRQKRTGAISWCRLTGTAPGQHPAACLPSSQVGREDCEFHSRGPPDRGPNDDQQALSPENSTESTYWLGHPPRYAPSESATIMGDFGRLLVRRIAQVSRRGLREISDGGKP
jgi:hypothetical protein